MKTLRVRIKDKHAKVLDAMACEVNMIWNFVNELSFKHTQRTGKFFSAYDMNKYTSGATKEGFLVWGKPKMMLPKLCAKASGSQMLFREV